MRRAHVGVGIGLIVGAFLASSAQAGPLVQVVVQFHLGTLPQMTFTASGGLSGSAHGTGASAIWWVGAGAVPGGTTTLTIPSSAAPPVDDMQYILNGNPGWASFSASVDGSMAVTGQANVKAYSGLTLLGVPVTVGTPSVILPPVVSGIGITGYANAWTTKTTSIFNTYMNALSTRMGSNGLVNGGGTVVMVTALNVLTSIAGQLPSFATLTLTYAQDAVAEPGALALLATGAACAWLGRRRRGGDG